MRETTQELLARLKDHAEHFNPNDWDDGETQENKQAVYETAKEISETLQYHEIALLHCLRCCPIGETHRFRKAAESLLDAYRTRAELSIPDTTATTIADGVK